LAKKPAEKKQKKCHYLYGCVRFGEDEVLRFTPQALRNTKPGFVVGYFNHHNPINQPKTCPVKYGIAVQKTIRTKTLSLACHCTGGVVAWFSIRVISLP